MTIVTPERKLIQIEEVQYRASVSEAVANKIAATVNLISNRQFSTIDFKINGNYNFVTGPQNDVDGYYVFPWDLDIVNFAIYHSTPGSGGTTEMDVKIASTSGGSFSSIFSVTPKIAASAGSNVFALGYDVTEGPISQTWAPRPAPSGVTVGTLISAPYAVSAGQAIRFDFNSKQSGAPEQCGLMLYLRPR